MPVSANINDFRRKVTHRLTRHLGASSPEKIQIADKSEIKRILVCRPNHRLGNLLLVTPLLDELAATFPDSQIDLFVKGTAGREIFKNYKNVNYQIELPRKPFKNPLSYAAGWLELMLRRYDLVINVDPQSSSGRLSTRWANARYRLYGGDVNDIESEKHLAKKPICQLRAGLNGMGIETPQEQMPQLSLKLTWLELTRGKKKLRDLIGNDGKTISLFTHATGAKCYSEKWWRKFYNKLRKRYQDYNIIEILPAENVSKLNFGVPYFYSKDIREIGSVIANTDVFIGADSGIMHLASASGAPTIGLFSVTDKTKYEPYNEKSVAVNTAKHGMRTCLQAMQRILAR